MEFESYAQNCRHMASISDGDREEFVRIEYKNDYEAQVRVTCPDKTGLGADITRTIFDFG